MNFDAAEAELTITEDIEHILKSPPFFLEIELLKGFVTKLPDGRKVFKITIDDAEKANMLMEFMLKVISKSHSVSKN